MTDFKVPSPGEVASGITVLLAASWVANVVWDYGFLAALGMNFRAVPTTLADHAQGSLNWLPACVLGSLSGFLISGASHMLSPDSRANLVFHKGKSNPVTSLLFADGLMVAFLFGMVWFFGSAALPVAIALGFLVLWTTTIFVRILVTKRWPTVATWWTCVFPLTAMLFGFGYSEGLSAVSNPSELATIRVAESERRVEVVHLYERGLLYIDGDHVAFVPWDSVSELEARMTFSTASLGVVCRLLPCPPRAQPRE